MELDLTAYEAVTDELEEAERQTAIRRLRIGKAPGPAPSAADEEAVYRWVKEFQTCRGLMQLVLLDLADVVVQDGEAKFTLAHGFPPDVLKELQDTPPEDVFRRD